MADYIYLLENRLSRPQKDALSTIRDIARERGITVFLVGGAVRDLTSGSPVRDLDVVVQGNALKLKRDLEKLGAVIAGENEAGQALFVTFPGGARVEIGSTLSATYPKPGKPVLKSASILDDLRRRDFTANAMALSLNAGSYGLLMDPLNGVADIENRELRLVSNYGFIEDPIRMVRAVRLMSRLGWQMDEKTQARYATGKQEGYISSASAFQRGYETEEIVHEEDPLRVMRGLEAEGWMALLTPTWNSSKANVAELERLRESQTHLQMQGIHPNPAAANFPLLTAKLSTKEVADLKASFARQGFVREIEALEAEAKEFAAQLSGKSSALPSQAWKLLHAAKPEAVLQVAHASKSPAIQAKFKSFYTEWPQARQKVPYALLQEMRIIPDLPGYDAFVETVVFELMDGRLGTVEEMKAFLEPFSPPAPPPPVHLRRARAAKKESSKSAKSRAKKSTADAGPPVEGEMEVVASATSVQSNAREAVSEKPTAVSLKPPAAAVKETVERVPAVEPAAAKTVAAKAVAVRKPVIRVVSPAPAKKTATKRIAPQKAVTHKTPAKPIVASKPAAAKKAIPVTKSSVKPVAKKAVLQKAPAKVAAKKVAAKHPVPKSAVKRASAKAVKPAKKVVSKNMSKAPVKKRR